MVVGHERSGNHFLMNTLSGCFGYKALPWLDFDHGSVPVNFFSRKDVRRFFEGIAAFRLANIIKTHHPLPFFEGNLGYICRHFKIIYIYRHPLDTLRSFWRLVEHFDWVEGPGGMDCNAFIKAPPMGYCMRYQMTQEASMVHRWIHHVEKWVDAAKTVGAVLAVRYEDLDREFERTALRIGSWLGIEPRAMIRPDRQHNVISPAADTDCRAECVFTDASIAFIRAAAGRLLSELGYAPDPGNNGVL
jgi:hypothetical protein